MQAIYEYKKINVSLEPSPDPHDLRKATIESAANRWAERGWKTVAVMPSTSVGYADAILIERIAIDKMQKPPHEGLLAVRYTDPDNRVLVLPPDRVEFVYRADDD